MTIEEYTTAILPLIEYCKKEKSTNSHAWYLYRQSFYGFIDFIDSNKRKKVSEQALSLYRKTNPKRALRKRLWKEQPTFDRGREKFHLEHIYSGDMFRKAISQLPSGELTVTNIVKIVRENYCVAWITKEENRRLPRSRGSSLKEALTRYKKEGIKLR
jgi:hypothetical protein